MWNLIDYFGRYNYQGLSGMHCVRCGLLYTILAGIIIKVCLGCTVLDVESYRLFWQV